MDQEMCRPHPSAAEGEPRGQEAYRGTIHRAVQLIMAEHAVTEMPAYAILVQASVDSRVSVREAARRIVTGSEPGQDADGAERTG